MKILVIGLGSMGKRRIRLIQELYPDFDVYGVDARADRREEAHAAYGITCFESVEEAGEACELDTAFVCTAPLSHSAIIKKCLENKWNVFTELNLVSDGYEENMALAKKSGCTLFLSSTFLYREEMKYIRKYVGADKKWNYIYHVGQYLPDWHPWENYKDFFVGDKRTDGCREMLAIEFPWLTRTFGDVEDAKVIADKITGLHIDYCDNYMIQLRHKNGNKGVLIVDVVSPVAVRKLEIYAENKYIRWDGTPDSLYEYDEKNDGLKRAVLTEEEEHREGYRAFVVENAYKNEIKEFVAVVQGRKTAVYGFEEDLQILGMIDSLEEAY